MCRWQKYEVWRRNHNNNCIQHTDLHTNIDTDWNTHTHSRTRTKGASPLPFLYPVISGWSSPSFWGLVPGQKCWHICDVTALLPLSYPPPPRHGSPLPPAGPVPVCWPLVSGPVPVGGGGRDSEREEMHWIFRRPCRALHCCSFMFPVRSFWSEVLLDPGEADPRLKDCGWC